MSTKYFSYHENLGPATLSDAVRKLEPGRRTGPHAIPRLKTLRAQDRALGPAYTIRLSRAPRSSDAQRYAFLDAYDQAPPGAMVVIETVGDLGGAAMGDLVARRLSAIGVAGVILDGAVRDQGVLRDVAPPSWFTQTDVCGILSREVDTEVGVTVRIADVLVRPGDLVCADADGAFVVPAAEAERTLSEATAIEFHEKILVTALATGSSLRRVLASKRTDP